jgi:membrane dipeptidase
MTNPIALHNSLLTIDTHIDIPWPDGPSFFEDGPRCVDLPKMRRGHLVAGCFAAYLGQGPRTEAAHAAAVAQAREMLGVINAMGKGGEARVCTTAAAIEATAAAGLTCVIPAVENGYAIGEDLANLKALRELGARYITLTHNGHNAIADSCNPRPDLGDGAQEHGGLSAFGGQVVAEMNRLGMLIDVAHAAKSTMMQATALSRVPVLSTHSCIRALCDHPRNLDDEQLDALGATGGLVQITAVPGFLKPHAPGTKVRRDEVSVADWAEHVDYAVRRIGIEHVGISSDFDGGGGFAGWTNASEGATLTAELLRRGYDAAAIALLWGGNFLRLLRLAEERAE